MSHHQPPTPAPAGLTSVSIRGKKRPKPSSSSTSTPDPTDTKRQRTSHPRPHPLTPLEALPPEILELIFLQNCNISLPRASPILARALASETLYRKLCDQVFSSFRHSVPSQNTYPTTAGGIDPASSHRSRYQEWQYYSVPQGSADAEDLAKARKEVLGCGWLSWRVFEGHRRRILGRERGRLNDVREMYKQEALDLWMDCEIPVRLLRKPMVREMRENVLFLDALVEEGCAIDSVNSFDNEVALEAFYEGVRCTDYRLVHRLLARGIEVQPDLDELCCALDKRRWNVPMVKLIGACLLSRSHDRHPGEKETPDVVLQLRLQDRALSKVQGGTDDHFRLKYWTHGKFRRIWQGSPCIKRNTALCDLCLKNAPVPPRWRARWHVLLDNKAGTFS